MRSLTSNLVDLFSELQSMSALAGMLGNGFDVQFLMENADSIDIILAGGSSIQNVVDRWVTSVAGLTVIVNRSSVLDCCCESVICA